MLFGSLDPLSGDFSAESLRDEDEIAAELGRKAGGKQQQYAQWRIDTLVAAGVPREEAQRIVAAMGDRLPKTATEVYAREQIILHERQKTEIVVQALRIGDIGIATTPQPIEPGKIYKYEIELMPCADDRLYSFKYVNGHPANPAQGKLCVVALGDMPFVTAHHIDRLIAAWKASPAGKGTEWGARFLAEIEKQRDKHARLTPVEDRPILLTDEARDYFASYGREPVASTPAAFAAVIRAEHAKWGKVIGDSKIKAETKSSIRCTRNRTFDV